MISKQTFIYLVISWSFVFTIQGASGETCPTFETSIQLAAKFRELPFIKEVSCHVLDRADLQSLFRSRVEKEIIPEKISGEGMAYKLLGFIPQNYNYDKCVIQSYVTDTLAFYRQEKNDYVVMVGAESEISTAVHELTHALQNQHFNILSHTNVKTEPSDGLMAKFALIEGDAVLVESSIPKSAAISQAGISQSSEKLEKVSTPKVECKPLIPLEELMGFPYEFGPKFVAFLKVKGGYKLVNEAFINPPTSTSQILHPEKFLDEMQSSIETPTSKLDDIESLLADRIFSDRMGEFFMRVLLSQYMAKSEFDKVLIDWSDDWLTLYQLKNDKQLLKWTSSWETAQSAQLFAALLSKTILKRFPTAISSKKDRSYIFDRVSIGNISIRNDGKYAELIIKVN